MPPEVSVAGTLVPGLLLIFLGCLLLMWLIDTVIGRLGLYRYVIHPPLVRLALFVCLFGAAGLLLLA
jgi:protein AaeX